MENMPVTKISAGGRMTEYGYIGLLILFCFVAWYTVFSIDVLAFMIQQRAFVWTAGLFGMIVLAMAYLIFWVAFRVAGRVLESADGTFLRVKINWTEKTLPLSAIQSIKISNHYYLGRRCLRVTVKQQSSFSGFAPGATFWFVPNADYFRSAFFRQYPIPPYGFAKFKDFMEISAFETRKKLVFGCALGPCILFAGFLITLPDTPIEMFQKLLVCSALIMIFIALVFTLLRIIFHVADSVLESADGTFLRVKIRATWEIIPTEKTLPLSAIASVKIPKGTHHLQITVKHQFSSNGFSPGATFRFLPNINYFRSTLFRQFPLPDDARNLGDWRL